MPIIDWNKAEQRAVTETINAVRDFAAEHSDEECCYFAFDSDPQYGYVLLCFDTTDNSRRSAQAREHSAVERRKQTLSGEQAWEYSSHFLRSPVLAPFGDDTGNFAFIGYRKLSFPDWDQFAQDPAYPAKKENCDDWLEGHFRVLVWKVVERLVAEGAFDCLRKSSPFMIGYGIHDQEMSIVRMINWKREKGS